MGTTNTTSTAALSAGTRVVTHCGHLGTVLTARADDWYEVRTDDGMAHWWPAATLTPTTAQAEAVA